ncbi:esterase family protein [Flavihumibacter sp. R14]|nr:esterase family protein [Flavihumibacter soli]
MRISNFTLLIQKLITLAFLLFTGTSFSIAATVDTIVTYSPAMKKNIKAVVIRPSNSEVSAALPVVYLLHGHGGNYANWISKAPELKNYSDQYKILIVCPDGETASWYFDSPELPGSRYETYISVELVNWIDKHYPTIKSKSGRAITGLSMGGHGALYLAFKHQDVFGAAGSMSGGLDLRPFPKNWSIAAHLGSYAEHPDNWVQNSVINLTHLLTPGSLKLMIDCGTQDFFYNVNDAFHQKLLDTNIPHDFISRPGTHDWNYWRNAVKYQLLFMSDYFSQNTLLRN